ncbi:MAG: lysylphosphatidylglycerol synthase transmembrane domain-containing protein [Candidatus Rifleibacteriota bacterium]
MKSSFSAKAIVVRLAIWLFIALVAAITVVAMFSDYHKVSELLLAIDPTWLLLIITAVLFNYMLRFFKWCFFLKVVGVSIPLGQNLWIFFAAFTMVLSPGKIGELVKSFLLKARFDIPVSRTAPVVMAERLTDLLGLMVLCLIGSYQFSFKPQTITALALLFVAGIILLTRNSFWLLLNKVIARAGFMKGFLKAVKLIQATFESLLTLKNLFISVLLSAVSWAGEGVALYFIFKSLNVSVESLLLISIFAHAFSSVVGALSFLPGGLLVTEGAMGLFFVYVSIPEAQALSATFLIRSLTLWFAVIIGTIVFLAGHSKEDLQALKLIKRSKSHTDEQPDLAIKN